MWCLTVADRGAQTGIMSVVIQYDKVATVLLMTCLVERIYAAGRVMTAEDDPFSAGLRILPPCPSMMRRAYGRPRPTPPRHSLKVVSSSAVEAATRAILSGSLIVICNVGAVSASN